MNEQMLDRPPSQTAQDVAFLRALAHVCEKGHDLTGPDSLAWLFLDDEQREVLIDSAQCDMVRAEKISPGMYELMIARTAFFDEQVANALARNIPQIVFMGAGYDTRACRYQERIRDTRIFELDLATTQRRKLELLQKEKVEIPSRVSFIAIDFSTQGIAEVLSRHEAYHVMDETLFIWEGVTYYLPKDAVEKTLADIKVISPPGSRLSFDIAGIDENFQQAYGFKELNARMHSKYSEEGIKFTLEKKIVAPFLSQHGFNLESSYDSAEMERRYLNRPDGSFVGRVTAIFDFIIATVNPPKE